MRLVILATLLVAVLVICTVLLVVNGALGADTGERLAPGVVRYRDRAAAEAHHDLRSPGDRAAIPAESPQSFIEVSRTCSTDVVVVEQHSVGLRGGSGPVTLGGILVCEGGALVLEGPLELDVGFVVVGSGSVLCARGQCIDLCLREPAPDGLVVMRDGTVDLCGEGPPARWGAVERSHMRGECALALGNVGSAVRPNDRWVLTTSTATYRDERNVTGGVPCWFGWGEDEAPHRDANARAMEKWAQATDGHGVEVVVAGDVVEGELPLPLREPLRYSHACGHAGPLTRPIRVRSSCGDRANTEWIALDAHDGERECEHPPDERGHWAFGGSAEGSTVWVQPGGTARMHNVELFRLGSPLKAMVHAEGDVGLRDCSLWCSFSQFVYAGPDSALELHRSVCFWSLVTGVHVERSARASVCENLVAGVHNALPGTPWNAPPHWLGPTRCLDFLFTAAVWNEDGRTVCRENVLCCSPSPVVGIWSTADSIGRPDEPCAGPCEDPARAAARPIAIGCNTFYNMEGHWGTLPDGKLWSASQGDRALFVPRESVAFPVTFSEARSILRENHWMVVPEPLACNLGPMDWSHIGLSRTRITDGAHFVLCPISSSQLQSCRDHASKLHDMLRSTVRAWEEERVINQAVRYDLELEVAGLIQDVQYFQNKLKEMEQRLDARMLTSQMKCEFGIGRSLFFKSLDETRNM